MAFADNLKKLREENKITQAELAKYLGVTQRTISYYETGKGIPGDPDILDKLVKKFGVSLDFLLLDEKNQDSKLHRLVNKLIKDTAEKKITWNVFDKAVYYFLDDYNNQEEADCILLFSVNNFSQYNGYTLSEGQSYFCNYKDGGYLIAKLSSNGEIIYSLFVLHEEEFHYITDMSSIAQVEELYLEVANSQNNIAKFIDSYLSDPLDNEKEEFPSEIFPDKDIPF